MSRFHMPCESFGMGIRIRRCLGISSCWIKLYVYALIYACDSDVMYQFMLVLGGIAKVTLFWDRRPKHF